MPAELTTGKKIFGIRSIFILYIIYSIYRPAYTLTTPLIPTHTDLTPPPPPPYSDGSMVIADDNALQLLLDLANTQPDMVANMMVEPENAELARNLQNGGGTLGFGYMLGKIPCAFPTFQYPPHCLMNYIFVFLYTYIY